MLSSMTLFDVLLASNDWSANDAHTGSACVTAFKIASMSFESWDIVARDGFFSPGCFHSL